MMVIMNMRKILRLFYAVFSLFFLTACGGSSDDPSDDPPGGGDGGDEPKIDYWNPVLEYSAPDPTCIRVDDGTYYLYGTEDTRNMPIYKSDDLVNWTFVGTAFTEATRPDFPTSVSYDDPSLWAPEIRYIKGKYVLFYSLAKWGQEWLSTVGYALSDSPEGPFIPQGYVFTSEQMGVQNSIDQFFWEEDGKYYMLWGSFHGIYIVELNVADDLSIITPKMETQLQVAGNAYEGVNVWKRGGYYYLFASRGSCCEGINSTYQTVVCRSESLTGPYLNKSGGQMLDNQDEVILSGTSDNTFKGTGHNSILQLDDAGQTWMLYHAYYQPTPSGDNGRSISLDMVRWNYEGWPSVNTGTPSVSAEVPVVHKK